MIMMTCVALYHVDCAHGDASLVSEGRGTFYDEGLQVCESWRNAVLRRAIARGVVQRGIVLGRGWVGM